MLEVRRARAISRDKRVPIWHELHFGRTFREHGLDGDYHSGHKLFSCSCITDVCDVRLFMDCVPDAVASELEDDAVSALYSHRFHGSADVADVITCASGGDAHRERFFGYRQKFSRFRVGLSRNHGNCVVGNQAVVRHAAV